MKNNLSQAAFSRISPRINLFNCIESVASDSMKYGNWEGLQMLVSEEVVLFKLYKPEHPQ
jgi:hypothetical protein